MNLEKTDRHGRHGAGVLLLSAAVVLLTWIGEAAGQAAALPALEAELKAFAYERVLTNGRATLAQEALSLVDRLRVLEYMLNAAYALQDTVQARRLADDMVALSPTFEPDARITSPKIIEFYAHSRRRAARQPHGRALPQDSSQVMWSQPRVALRTEYLLASLVLPGSGHLLARHNKKGLVFSAASLAVLGGILHYARQTRVREREYLRATGEADYDRLYARYNAAYKRRNALMAGYGLLSVLALYDLHSRANRSVAVALAYEPSAPQLLLHLNKSW